MSDTLSQPLPTIENENEIIALIKPNPRQILRICLNLKKLIDTTITSKKSISDISKLAKSKKTIQLALEACGGKGDGEPNTSSRKYRSSIVFCLLVVTNWYSKIMTIDYNEYDTSSSRKDFSEYLSRHLIEHFMATRDETYLFINVLCTKFSVNLNDVDQPAKNALEVAIDLHSIPVITSNGFQKCIKYLWRGWIVQSAEDGNTYQVDVNYSSSEFLSHFNPNRLKAPKYQNYLEIFFSIIYLILFTFIINCEDKREYLLFEIGFYMMTFCFLGDELINVYHVGLDYLKFWNYFNNTMYIFITVAFITRTLLPTTIFADGDDNEITAFKILSCVAPFMWTRLLFYLDCFEYIGVIIVVIAKMMKESFLFFVLLSIIVIGFLQGFIGLDTSDGEIDMFPKILHSMIKSIIAGAQFPVFDSLTPPYSVYIYYVFRFLINVMLMKILSALYNNSYKETVGHSSNEYLALFSSKVLRYIRAPDEFVYIPPLNIVEWVMILLSAPFGVSRQAFDIINFYILQAIYSPALFLIAVSELKEARRIKYNRMKNLSDDCNETDLEWDLTDGFRELQNSDETDMNDAEYNDTVIRQGAKLQRLAEREDPEFLVNLNEFNKKLIENEDPVPVAAKPAVPSDGADKVVGADIANLGVQITTLLSCVEKISTDNKKLFKENEEIKKKLKKLEDA
ncbi:hypothetical protein DASC09_016900 [Saccharomycopsis crataegensis]|uniref:Calcium channel YVC1 n=1 Tax=Saccharomycopsis crataegensis TaxID=43959 RepID=A0AAV5QIQ3_9ASCO|nr:hypothetical protein DASC09_016900 [Saccharomycopsis crataegensis]